jgi:antitoxin YefM
MQSVHRLKANELDDRFLESLKAQWGDREIEIVISDADETAYLMSNEANRQRLLKAVNDIDQRHNLVEVDLEAILSHHAIGLYGCRVKYCQ